MPTIVAMADTHSYHRRLCVPPGDILIHAGDITRRGAMDELRDFDAFLAELPHRHKVVIAGNHDWCFQRKPRPARAALKHAIYLEDEAVEIEGLKIYGSPWQPWFLDWAFNLPRGPELGERWAKIPDDTEILVTHGPPLGFGDRTFRGDRVGCEDLLKRVREVKPSLHIYGHIHEDGGIFEEGGVKFVNATTAECASGPVVIEYPGRPK
jgi:Icc-related predicted phosphoesterase